MQSGKLLGAILLIAGTAIGAGMLALPVLTGTYGFLASSIILIVCWVFFAYTALLMLEVNLWLEPDSNLVSMAKETLGTGGQIVAWLFYLLLLYSLMAAYLSGMDALIKNTLDNMFHIELHEWAGSISLITLFGIIIYLGATSIDFLNRFLIMGLVTAYIVLIALVSPHVDISRLSHANFHKLWLTLPIIATSYGFHIIIPSLRTYLNGDAKKLRLAIIIGSTAPLIIYLLWEFLILGVLPVHGKDGLLTIFDSGQPGVGLTMALKDILDNNWITIGSRFFVFFAIATSFIGVSFSLFDFLSDGFKIKKTKLGRLSSAAITFIPPLIFAEVYPRGFIIALGFAGLFVAILLVMLPALMAWSGRYNKKIAKGYRVVGGKLALVLTTLFAVSIIAVEFIQK